MRTTVPPQSEERKMEDLMYHPETGRWLFVIDGVVQLPVLITSMADLVADPFSSSPAEKECEYLPSFLRKTPAALPYCIDLTGGDEEENTNTNNNYNAVVKKKMITTSSLVDQEKEESTTVLTSEDLDFLKTVMHSMPLPLIDQEEESVFDEVEFHKSLLVDDIEVDEAGCLIPPQQAVDHDEHLENANDIIIFEEPPPRKKIDHDDISTEAASSSSNHHQQLQISDMLCGGDGDHQLVSWPWESSKRKRSVPWTEKEQQKFVQGIEGYGWGNWKLIAERLLPTKTPFQLASHAQKFKKHHNNANPNKRRRKMSIHDTVPVNVETVVF